MARKTGADRREEKEREQRHAFVRFKNALRRVKDLPGAAELAGSVTGEDPMYRYCSNLDNALWEKPMPRATIEELEELLAFAERIAKPRIAAHIRQQLDALLR